ncbi:cysteine-rich receptor-like protein kinase 44 [Miscanthus floridulus]|uniref:cysteine-rich receptor-like protein kinase 44 n=1 Tax=Miscanthus floridulus TaxID=154761 RepID=UPI003457A240
MDSEASMLDHIERMLLDESAEPSDMPLSFLRAITNNFSDEQIIGRGGFAVVYEGRLRNGRSVAVKKFSDTTELPDNRYYIKEVESMIRLKHKNIVRVFGYCADTQWKMVQYHGRHVIAEIRQRLLCFEFVPGGSLDKYISDMSEGLEWRQRYQIIRGICEGLHYLHEENVLHLDVKPGNILLDYNLVPKITDFGLSRCFDDKQTRATTRNVMGTLGYMAPESSSGVITFKSDVYSLGIIITEMLTGRKGYCQIEYVLESWKTRLKMPMGDTLEQIRVCVEIGIMCIDSNPDNRPDLRHIIRVLNEMESMYMVTETTTSSSLVTQGSDEHVITAKIIAAITDEKQQKVSLLSTLPKNLPFQFLEEITDGFSKEREVGRGGFGVVYKGLLVDGHSIAVRRLFRFQGIQMKHIANEVNILMELRHKNIVNLLGYCHEDRHTAVEYQGKLVWAETSEQLLCYEYLDYGSIDKYIFVF